MKRKYKIYTAMTIYTPEGDVVVERNEKTRELTFFTPRTIDGERLTEIKQENESKINKFRTGGGQGETV